MMILKLIVLLCGFLLASPAFPNPFVKKKPKTTTQMVSNTNFLVFPEDIGRYINEIRLRPSILVPLLEDKIKTFADDKKIMVGSALHSTF